MALNMDDLIGSMQHGFHAGDRGNDLQEIRDSLKISLGQQPQHQPTAGPSNSSQAPYQFTRSRQPFPPPPQHGGSSLDADVAMLSSSQNYSHQLAPGGQFFGSGGGPGSWGSQSSTGSGQMGGWGFAPAPANTPQQTPVETSALARQLQAELERNASASPQYQNATLSPGSHGSAGGFATSPPTAHAHDLQQGGPAAATSPRSYVNGFSPRTEDGSTPTPPGRIGSARPQQQQGLGRSHGQ